jgi:hypothetical protein
VKPRQQFDGLTAAAISKIAELFGAEAQRQPFDLPNDSKGVWGVHHRSESGNIRVLLWPAINRIDVAVGPHMWVVKGVSELEVIEDLEFIARFGTDGVLTVALSGQVVLTTPADE